MIPRVVEFCTLRPNDAHGAGCFSGRKPLRALFSTRPGTFHLQVETEFEAGEPVNIEEEIRHRSITRTVAVDMDNVWRVQIPTRMRICGVDGAGAGIRPFTQYSERRWTAI